jgi:hypothetical protein
MEDRTFTVKGISSPMLKSKDVFPEERNTGFQIKL